MIPNLPAGTITTGYHSPGRGRYVHPWEPRVITSCEAALIQGFPIDYQFNDGKSRFSRASHAKVIGDAVSPVMSRFIGLFIGVETRLSDLLCASNAIHAC
jgi:DNA (cytosine-5)-methyltransferase 1